MRFSGFTIFLWAMAVAVAALNAMSYKEPGGWYFAAFIAAGAIIATVLDNKGKGPGA